MKRFFLIGALVLVMALVVPAAVMAFASQQDNRHSPRMSASESDGVTEASATADGEQKPWVGLYVMEVTDRLADKLDIDAEDGVAVVKVVEDGPADDAGIERGDVIASIDGSGVSTVSDVRDAVGAASVGDTLSFTVERDGSESTYNVTVGERPAREGKAECTCKGRKSGSGARPEALSSAGIGAVVASLNADLAEKLEIEAEEGVAVVKVVEDGPADDAGLEAGDVIVSVDGADVDSVSDVREAVRDAEAGDTLSIVITRENQAGSVTYAVTVEEGYGVGRRGGPGGWRGAFPGKIFGEDGESLSITAGAISVAAIGADSVTLTPSGDGAEDITATVTDGSMIVKDGEKAELGDLAVDDEGHAVIANGDLKVLFIGDLEDIGRRHFRFGRFGGGDGDDDATTSRRFGRGFGGGALTLPPGFGGRDFFGPLDGFGGTAEAPREETT